MTNEEKKAWFAAFAAAEAKNDEEAMIDLFDEAEVDTY